MNKGVEKPLRRGVFPARAVGRGPWEFVKSYNPWYEFTGGRGCCGNTAPVRRHVYFRKAAMPGSRKLAVLLALFLVLGLGLSLARGQREPSTPRRSQERIQHLSKVERQIYRLTNAVRRKNHLPPLDRDNALVATARAHSDDMLRRSFFNHTNPDGKTPQDRIIPAYSRTIARAGENIWGGHGHDYSDSNLIARVIVDSWVTSPSHRANLLNPRYTHLGVGVSALGKEVRATQNFVQR
jgi:uncharacterized protein YkwD